MPARRFRCRSVLSGVACAFVGLCYAELAAMIPASGSAYTYTYATVGEIFAWIIGWDLILEYAMGASTVAVGWSGYFVSLLGSFGIHIPPQWADATGQAVKLADGTIGHRDLQLACRADRPDPDGAADVRHHEFDPGQQHHGRVQAVRRRRGHRGRRFLRQSRALDAFHSGEYRHIRKLRLQRHPAWRLRRVLRLYRLRRCLDRGAGSETAAAGHADRHPGLADRSARSSMC